MFFCFFGENNKLCKSTHSVSGSRNVLTCWYNPTEESPLFTQNQMCDGLTAGIIRDKALYISSWSQISLILGTHLHIEKHQRCCSILEHRLHGWSQMSQCCSADAGGWTLPKVIETFLCISAYLYNFLSEKRMLFFWIQDVMFLMGHPPSGSCCSLCSLCRCTSFGTRKEKQKHLRGDSEILNNSFTSNPYT